MRPWHLSPVISDMFASKQRHVKEDVLCAQLLNSMNTKEKLLEVMRAHRFMNLILVLSLSIPHVSSENLCKSLCTRHLGFSGMDKITILDSK